jgi:hypothetical protein
MENHMIACSLQEETFAQGSVDTRYVRWELRGRQVLGKKSF